MTTELQMLTLEMTPSKQGQPQDDTKVTDEDMPLSLR